MTLLNADIDGDNEVTLFDFGLLVDAFGSTPGDPNWNPDADLDGDDEVTLQGMQRRVGEVNPYARLYRSEGSLDGRLNNLVVAFADAGWSASNPSAPEGSAFLKATAALGRLIGAGMEIQGYASLPLAIGGLGTGIIIGAADDLTGTGARLAGGRFIPKLASPSPTVWER
ncbi:MAG: hypothetical protein ACUVTY_14780 [Armatimonadota bacterium]